MPFTKLSSRRHFLQLASLAAAGVALTACDSHLPSSEHAAAPQPPITTADQALQRLLEGNRRFAAAKSTDLDESLARRVEVIEGQHPFATIFSCVDSRVPPELIFDQGIGDLLVIRTAGHVIDRAVLGSLEFGVAELHIPLLLVLGHERCGAVKATLEAAEKQAHGEADIDILIEGIRPAVERTQGQQGDRLTNTIKVNTALIVDRLKHSPILSEAVEQGKLKIVGAFYDLHTGKVDITVT